MTNDERNQLNNLHALAARCNDVEPVTLDQDDRAAIVYADGVITKLQESGAKGGSATTEAKAKASAANGRKGGRPKKAR